MKQTRTARVKWTAPNRNGYETNFDSAMFHDSGEAGLGLVIWNHEGEVMAGLSEKIPFPPSVTQLELIVARRVALLVQEVGLRNSILEGDWKLSSTPFGNVIYFNLLLVILFRILWFM